MLFQQDQYCIVDNKPLNSTQFESSDLYCSNKCKLQDSETVKPATKKSGKIVTYSTVVRKQNKKLSQPTETTFEIDESDVESVFKLDDITTNSYNSQYKSYASSLPSLLNDVTEYDTFDDEDSLYEVEELEYHHYSDDDFSKKIPSQSSANLFKNEWLYETPNTSKTFNSHAPSTSIDKKEVTVDPITQINSDFIDLSIQTSKSYSLKSKSTLKPTLEFQDDDFESLRIPQMNPPTYNYQLWLRGSN
ncbi:hypothetical protein CANARDRAFT_28630 [[Candida] arabinofermentans NRRL YB-2248]|uniref:Uncharacterized protein n=1 Tax=[Candida] arabinofermentans NRRL YB-2248 TaxID=983967 RepID=A0A1E4SZI8_9ASCO|nr:hypothetical protein CANARDRAFT_28630 [[Candida] arabinofermentans NRRL YB-2248]